MDEITRNRYPRNNWKQDLRVSQHHFAEHEGFGEGVTSVCVAVERYVMHCALAVRKLLDQQALTEEVRTRNWRCRSYPCTRQPEKRWWFEGIVDMENLHHFVRYYDIEQPRPSSLTLQRLANYLLHSFVFAVQPPGPESAWSEARFYFNSDHNYRDHVYEMRVAEFEAVIDEILCDEAVWMSSDSRSGRVIQHNATWRRQLYCD
jgi:hypothetical protein